MTRMRQRRGCTSFARAAVFTEFRYKDARALRHNGFKDRAPHEKLPLPPLAWRRETDKSPGNWGEFLPG